VNHLFSKAMVTTEASPRNQDNLTALLTLLICTSGSVQHSILITNKIVHTIGLGCEHSDSLACLIAGEFSPMSRRLRLSSRPSPKERSD
jgi:hypothetical protein